MNSVNILTPNLPESVKTATIIIWHKKIGDFIKKDEILVEIETDKIILEVPAISDGILYSILEKTGNIVNSQQILGTMTTVANNTHNNPEKKSEKIINDISQNMLQRNVNNNFSPTVRRLLSSNNMKTDNIQGTGINHRITKQDIEKTLDQTNNTHEKNINNQQQTKHLLQRNKTRIKMTHIRKCIADRLVHVKRNTAMLTTFNEVNMQQIVKLRKKYGQSFQERHSIKLGLMSFYVKAVVEGLKRIPEINTSVDNEDIIYYNYFDINVAISTPKGLVTPVIRNANLMSMADIEKKIKKFATKAKLSQLSISDLIGGNFTITNGGVFGSLLSTPIINPPQTAILGIHNIHDRPIAINNEVCIRPMMYIALSYDHRIIDGKEAISFLLVVKNILEDFNRIILDI
ncbi:dihydrolipoyllysine-residue succinyltransferase [Buchnera aphidicola (Formosaphis micheliae)]|uniref:dihydrolipoyllysine-residue succinyltransferase n=1 Tax=Buchnera aphidicola TaxID=9 RepID=UPI0031CCAFA9